MASCCQTMSSVSCQCSHLKLLQLGQNNTFLHSDGSQDEGYSFDGETYAYIKLRFVDISEYLCRNL